MPIRITSKQEGFRRCGVPHSTDPTDWPDDRWSKKELETLKAEPMLVVQEVPEASEAKKSAKSSGGKDDK